MAENLQEDIISENESTNIEERFHEKKCVFCSKAFSKKNRAVTADSNHLDILIKACNERKDKPGLAIITYENKIRTGDLLLKYHRNCRSSYQSSHHVKRAKSTVVQNAEQSIDSDQSFDTQAGNEETRFTRSNVGDFDWKENCFLCGKKFGENHRNEWSLVASIEKASDTGTMFRKTLNAARRKGDNIMLARLLGIPNEDLVACEARYHRKKTCFLKYIGEKQDKAVDNLCGNMIHKVAREKLIDEYHDRIIIGKEVVMLSSLRERYFELLEEAGLYDTVYSSNQLKKMLGQCWPEVSFLHQNGKSDIVCSSMLSIGDVLRKSEDISTNLEFQTGERTPKLVEGLDEENIMHIAVGILRS